MTEKVPRPWHSRTNGRARIGGSNPIVPEKDRGPTKKIAPPKIRFYLHKDVRAAGIRFFSTQRIGAAGIQILSTQTLSIKKNFPLRGLKSQELL